MRLAITTDWLTSFGGAERVLTEMRNEWGNVPVFTSVYDPRGVPEQMRHWDIRPSYLQKFPLVLGYSRALLPLMPFAFGRFDFRNYDAVISNSSAFSKAIATSGKTRHLCYCLTPPRYLWDLADEYLGSGVKRRALQPVLTWLQHVDLDAARRVDQFVAISKTVADRIQRIYGRSSTIVYPPVDTEAIRPNQRPPEDFYLVVSRLVRYKRVDLAIRAAQILGRKLIVVGDGPEAHQLRAMTDGHVQMVGKLSDADIADLYARCRGFLFPGFEDFGIAPVEAQAAGRPVVAYGRGGATETVIDGVTGVHFEEQSAESLADGIERLERLSTDPVECRQNSTRFSASSFRTAVRRTLESMPDRRSAIA